MPKQPSERRVPHVRGRSIDYLLLTREDVLARGAIEADFVTDPEIVKRMKRDAIRDIRKSSVVVRRPEEVWTELPLGDRQQWTVGCRLLPQDHGTPVICELRIAPHHPDNRPWQWVDELAGPGRARIPAGGGINSALLRKIRLGLSDDAWKYYLSWLERAPKGPVELPTDKAILLVQRKSRRTDSYLASVASRYCDLIHQGDRRPNERIAKELKSSASKVRDMLSACRKRGLLTRPAQMGQRGGILTEKARALLKEES